MKPVEALQNAGHSLGIELSLAGGGRVSIQDPARLRAALEGLVRTAVLAREPERGLARWLIRRIAIEAGAVPASIDALYRARGRGEVRTDFTVPAINLRALTYHAARAVFRAAQAVDAGALIFEIARSEMGYTDQRPAEYSACVLAAAASEGYRGPVFIQGDHFQVSAKRYAANPQAEMDALRELIGEAIGAGFYNIDIDTSTLVDLTKESIPEQQRLNYTLCADFTAFIREIEPEGVTISVGGEIGEVGGHNSTEPELRAFMDGYNRALRGKSRQAVGLSKISIQTGTSHGGVVLPDGTIAQVQVDFETLASLSRLASEGYGLGGAVQHGASTLPEQAFTKFAEAGALEVHLATNFQNMLFDRLPKSLRADMYAHLDHYYASERKAGQSDEQFYYKTRKNVLGPFKARLWDLPAGELARIEAAWEKQFTLLFDRLKVQGTQREVEQFVRPARIAPPLGDYVSAEAVTENVADLAD